MSPSNNADTLILEGRMERGGKDKTKKERKKVKDERETKKLMRGRETKERIGNGKR